MVTGFCWPLKTVSTFLDPRDFGGELRERRFEGREREGRRGEQRGRKEDGELGFPFSLSRAARAREADEHVRLQ